MNEDIQTTREQIKEMMPMVGGRIRLLRESCGFTQSEFAIKSGMTTQNLSKIEQGAQLFGIDKAIMMALSLDATLGYIVFGSDSLARLARMSERFRKIENTQYLLYEDARRFVAEVDKHIK